MSWQKEIKSFKSKKWSHWGDLNSRPSHYQWDAIPLSHSGDIYSRNNFDLMTAEEGSKLTFQKQQTQNVENVRR